MTDLLKADQHGHDVWYDSKRDRNLGVSPMPFLLVAAVDAPTWLKEVAWVVCNGTADDVDIQAAVDALPSFGGRVQLSEGTFTLAASIARSINDVAIVGMGSATRLNNDGSAAIISFGSQIRWYVADLETDAGGVNVGSGASCIARYWKNGTPTDDRSTVTIATEPIGIVDPGNGNAIPVTRSGYCALVTTGAETRTLAAPAFIGQRLLLYFKTDGGNCVVTCTTTVNETGNNTITFTDTGEATELIGVEEGGNLRWRTVFNDGAALTTA